MTSLSSVSTLSVGTSGAAPKAKPQRRRRCCHGGVAFFDALKAMATRLMFLLHAVLVAWRASLVQSDRAWYMALVYPALVLETVVVLAIRKGQEWKWFSPCVLLYLMAAVPGIWILEEASVAEKYGNTNTTNTVSVGSLLFTLTLDEWTWALSQSMLVLIIVGRWMLPKGDLSRDQLSGLLLSYVGIASDIIDFGTILEEDETLSTGGFFYVVIFVWSWSLLQFAFVRTATKDDLKSDDDDEQEDAEDPKRKAKKDTLFQPKEITQSNRRLTGKVIKQFLSSSKSWLKLALETEVWAIVLGLSMQDGPYLIVRMIAIFQFNVISDSNLFFVAKNFLVLVLQLYRLVALYREHSQMRREQKEKRRKEVLKLMYRNAFLVGKLGTIRTIATKDYVDMTA